MNTWCVPGTVLGSEDGTENKTDRKSKERVVRTECAGERGGQAQVPQSPADKSEVWGLIPKTTRSPEKVLSRSRAHHPRCLKPVYPHLGIGGHLALSLQITLPSLPLGSCPQTLNVPGTLSKIRLLGRPVKRTKSLRTTLNKSGVVARTTTWCNKEFMVVTPCTCLPFE